MGVTGNNSMKVLIFSTLAVLALVSSGEDDPGNSTTCPEEFQSCMTAMITVHNTTSKHEDHDVIYLKNCAKTEVYHASGCLHVDDQDEVITFEGSLCYCETDNCNNNFDANKNDAP